ncbi:hypothetical protein ABW20_dc0100832 [Dactylellina cionopaga]|nr:hypothetical protein ABW20_dc0100832 [Dactylellina cionopaga]
MAESSSSFAGGFSDDGDLAEMKSAQELADLEKLSQAFEADVTGPLVGNLQSSQILQAEYANADPVYVRKTAALSPKYSNYRTIRGDGNCGWRALAFGYFELLLRTGDQDFIQNETGRLKSLCSYMNDVGMSEYVYEDFVEETMDLLNVIGKAPVVDNPYDDTTLIEAFNQDDKSNAIITHLKLLTSAHLKLHPDAYEAFIETSIAEYCSSQIEPYTVQIDHIGVKALIDVLLIPAGFEVEISYLDRSDGNEVNVHRFEDEEAKEKGDKQQKTLRMLYRPGHYDLIYKNGDLAPTSLPTPDPTPASSKGKSEEHNVQVSMMLGTQYTRNPFTSSLFSPTSSAYNTFAPGIGYGGIDIYDQSYPGLRAYRSHDGKVSTLLESTRDIDAEIPTKLFKNGHYNTSHYQNENFQPEMWNPED